MEEQSMTDPIVIIEPTELNVEPGGQARVEVTIRNTGSIVENYRVDVVGEVAGQGPPEWAQVHPPEVSVYPKEKGTAIVVLAPPAGIATGSGRFPFGIRVISTVPPHASAVAEGDVEVGRMFGLQATITPLTSTGRWRGRHLLKYTNWGNAPVRLRLSARDPDERLGFLLEPTDLELPLGGSSTARLTVRTRKPFLRGTPARLPFEVIGEQDQPGLPAATPLPGDPRRPVLNAVLVQKPILSRASVAVAGLAVLVAAGAVLLAVKAPKNSAPPEATGLPDPPTGIQAQPNGATEVDVSWQLIPNVASYQVITRLAGKNVDTQTVRSPTQVFKAKGLTPNTVYCFTVQSVRDPTHLSSATRVRCVQTAPAGSSTSVVASSGGPSSGATSSGVTSSSAPPSSNPASSPTGSPSAPSGSAASSGTSTGSNGQPLFGPNDYVVLIGEFRGPNAQQGANTEKFKVSSQGFTPDGVLDTTDYPGMTILGDPVINGFWAAYAGPFDENTARAQQTSCVNITSDNCVVAKPGPSQ
jgi:hypothetical protein